MANNENTQRISFKLNSRLTNSWRVQGICWKSCCCSTNTNWRGLNLIMVTEEAEYSAFEQKVRRTLYIDNLSPRVTEAVLRNALNQFGNVKKVQFIPNYTEPRNAQLCALVEMENSDEAQKILSLMCNFPFMMSGMPRPVRTLAAQMEMFDEFPRKPGRRRLHYQWLRPEDPNFEVAKKLKLMINKHASEASFLLQRQLMEDEKLASNQEENLRANHKKHMLVESVLADGTVDKLAQHYNMKYLDD